MSPETIALKPEGLQLQWPDGSASIGAGTLRAACRCADCRAAALQGRPHQAAPGVQLTDARAVGHYALQLVFSDGHERGVYPWEMLRSLGTELN